MGLLGALSQPHSCMEGPQAPSPHQDTRGTEAVLVLELGPPFRHTQRSQPFSGHQPSWPLRTHFPQHLHIPACHHRRPGTQ